ncbi:MAG: hypothetical protein EBR88_08305, partial [Betaproteobacteria bacterium]|nr:hypothetical protein [Betaproteobacteria bacterium]
RRDWTAAEAALLDALRQQPDAHSLHASVGVVLRLRGEPDRAIEVHQALLARPELPEDARSAYTMALAEAMKAANSVEPGKILPALARLKMDGVTGPIAFDEKGDIVGGTLTLFTYRGGKRELVRVIQ